MISQILFIRLLSIWVLTLAYAMKWPSSWFVWSVRSMTMKRLKFCHIIIPVTIFDCFARNYIYLLVNSTIMDICESCLVPASSMLDSNFSYCEELWQILQRFPYYDRYRIYGRWKNDQTKRSWILTIQRSKALGMTKYAMKWVTLCLSMRIMNTANIFLHAQPIQVFFGIVL